MSSMVASQSFDSLAQWFLRNRRPFPWREKITPYGVWVSEVMLQQTVASVVVSYFERWMERFPTVQSLSEASEDEVIKMWEGLGYYSRARNLHAGAKQIVKEYGGELPSNRDDLLKIKGIGPYTVGAILSFAFHQRALAVDGNVKRVLSRYFCDDDFPKTILPEKEPWVVAEALIELGATLCGKKPVCSKCPLQLSCRAYNEGRTEEFPKKKVRPQVTILHRRTLILVAEESVLLKRGAAGAVMAGLWEFPYVEKGEDFFPFEGEHLHTFSKVTHTFTRYKSHLYPELWDVERFEVDGHEWVERKDLENLAFSSGHRQVLNNFLSLYAVKYGSSFCH